MYPAEVSQRNAHQDHHPVAALESGEDALPVARYRGRAGHQSGQLGRAQHPRNDHGQAPFDDVAGEHQHAAAASHVPENVCRAGPPAAGGEDVDALEARHQVGEGNAAQEVTDQRRREYAGNQR